MKILVTNDDGYTAEGIKVLVRAVSSLGDVTVVAPKYHQSGMAMAVSMGFKPIAVKELGLDDQGVRWIYLDGTPASCVKFGIDNVFTDEKPDLVLSGINHGSNAATAACYSGTLGAAQEAAINGVPAVGVSLDSMKMDSDFSAVEKLFPDILKRIIALPQMKAGSYFNVNFPNIAIDKIKGVRVGHMGRGHWEKEFADWNPEFFNKFGIDHSHYGLKSTEVESEAGESIYMMVGHFVDESTDADADHHLVKDGFISIVEHNFDNTDYSRIAYLKEAGVECDYNL